MMLFFDLVEVVVETCDVNHNLSGDRDLRMSLSQNGHKGFGYYTVYLVVSSGPQQNGSNPTSGTPVSSTIQRTKACSALCVASEEAPTTQANAFFFDAFRTEPKGPGQKDTAAHPFPRMPHICPWLAKGRRRSPEYGTVSGLGARNCAPYKPITNPVTAINPALAPPVDSCLSEIALA